MEIVFSNYILNIDVDATINAYKGLRMLSEGCSCDGCLNYEQAIEGASEGISHIFRQLGIAAQKPAEVYVNYSKNGSVYYGGFYHICGEIVNGDSPWEFTNKSDNSQLSKLAEEKMIVVNDDFKFAFQKDCFRQSDCFTALCIQMEILVSLPWVLEKENIYQRT